MNRFAHHAPRNLSEMPRSWFVVPAVLWSVAVAAALIGTPSNDLAGAQSARTNASEVAVAIEGA